MVLWCSQVKRSKLRDLLGDDWLMELGLTVRDFANAYQRATWKPFLECLEDERGGWGGHISLINIKVIGPSPLPAACGVR